MIVDQIVQALMQPIKWLVVGWQDQDIIGDNAFEFMAGIDPVSHRIAIRLCREDGHIGRNARQHLVA